MTDTDRTYVRRRPGLSWHVVRTHTRMFNGWRTLCGRSIIMDDGATLGVLPGEKSCESCLRTVTRAGDMVTITVEDDGSTQVVEMVP